MSYNRCSYTVRTNGAGDIECEAHTSRRLKKLIVTRLPHQRRTITHKASGWAMTSLLPISMCNIPHLIAFAEALEAMEHPAWAIIDAATPAKGLDNKNLSGREVDLLRDFAGKARTIGIDIVTKR